MVVVEGHNCLDVNGVNSQDEELDLNLLHFWDFPLENVGVDDFVGEWDDSKSECFGPIPLETLMVPTIHRSKFDHVDKTHESKPLASYVAEESGSQLLSRMKCNEELGLFQTQSPVSALESSGSCSTGFFGAIPVQPRSKSVRRRPRVDPWNMMSPWHANEPSEKTLNAKQYKGRGKKFSHFSTAVETKTDSSQKRVCLSQASVSVEQQNDLLLHYAMTKKCTHCKITKTPQWREGPMGPKTLCNACGVRYRSGRLFPEYRPAASPTFLSELHSNSHKKVLEMRYKATQHAHNNEEALMIKQETQLFF